MLRNEGLCKPAFSPMLRIVRCSGFHGAKKRTREAWAQCRVAARSKLGEGGERESGWALLTAPVLETLNHGLFRRERTAVVGCHCDGCELSSRQGSVG